MDLKIAKKVLKKVECDYDAIAKEWDITRSAPRAYQVKTAEGIKKGQKVLDVGCGNGVLYDVLVKKSIDYTGVDLSSHLLKTAQKRLQKYGGKIKLLKGNIIGLPLRDKAFDWVLALAVLHHIPSKELQKKSAQEIYRVLKPRGRAVVSVWNLYTDYARNKFNLDDLVKPEGWEENDLLTPWRATPKKTIQRYLYRFDKKELRDLFKSAGFKKIKVYYGDADGKAVTKLQKSYNIIALVQK